MRRSWTDRIAMTAVFCANGLVYGGLAGSVPRLRDLGRLGPAQLGIALLAISIGATIAMPAAGRLSPRLGAATLALAGGVLGGLLLPLPALALQQGGGLAGLLAAFLLFGMAIGLTDVAMNARASELEQAWGPVMSSFHGGWSLGGLAGAGLAAFGAARDVSAAGALLGIGGLAALMALAALRLIRFQHRAAPGTLAAPLRLRLRLPARGLGGLCAVACLCFSMEGAVADWMGVYLRGALGASQAMAGGAYAGFAALMAAGRLTGDRAVRRFGPAATMRAGALLAAFGMAAGLALARPLPAAAMFALAGLGLANVVPVAFSAAGRRAGAAGIGAVASLGYIGLMAGPPLLGFAAQLAGLEAALAYVLAGALAIAVLARAVR
jgi:MFS family permease